MTALRADISAVLRSARPLDDNPSPAEPALAQTVLAEPAVAQPLAAQPALAQPTAGPGQRRRQKNQRQHPGSAPSETTSARGERKPRHGKPERGNLTLVPAAAGSASATRDGTAPEAPAIAWTAAAETPAPDATFASLGVPAFLVAALEANGITRPFPIQAATLPDALAGRDILGRAQTGSGKTLGFSLPLVARLASGVTAAGRPRGLVLVPTRELATQVQEVLQPLAESMGLRVATIFGGVSYRPQIAAMQRRTDIVVACPGRLWDIIEQGHCDLGDVEITVLDEADHMADLGFLPTVRRLLDGTPAGGQRLLFSATLDGAVDVLAKSYMSKPVLHSVDDTSTPVAIEHRVFTVTFEHRTGVLADLTSGDNRSLVFTRTKHGAEKLAKKLTEAGIPAVDLHGNLSQASRARNLGKFSAGHVRVLVATDVAARGIHVDGVDLVIHADPPVDPKAFTHRSGRTARGGASGTVITVQTKSQSRDVSRMMRAAGVTPATIEAAEPGSESLRTIAGPAAPPPVIPDEPPASRRPRKGRRERGYDTGHPGSGTGRPGTGAGRPGTGTGRPGSGAGHPRRPRRQDEESSRPGSWQGRSGQIGTKGGRVAGKHLEHGRGGHGS